MNLLAFGQRIANLENAIVGQTHDVTWPRLLDGTLALSHELSRRGETQGLALTYMQIWLISHELTAAYLTEGDT